MRNGTHLISNPEFCACKSFKMAGKVSKNMAIGAGIIGFMLLGCGLGCAVAGFVWTAYGAGAHGVWSGILVSTLCLSC